MTTIRWGHPLPVHVPFHQSAARYRVAFGAAGSGKSYAGCDEAIAWCLEQPGIEGMVTRKTAPELRDTTERVFQARMPAELWNAGTLRRAGGHFESFTFPNGSRVLFRSIDDWIKHKSLNLGFIFFDELTEFDYDTFHGMRTRLRQRELTPEAYERGYTGIIKRHGAWGATNPAGHDWVFRLFHPASRDPERITDSTAFFSTTLDNPFLAPDYVDDLLNMPRQYVLRYVLCQFDDFAGRIYDTFGEPGTIVPHPQWDHRGPVVWMGMDPGTQNPTAGVWAWVDEPNHRLVAIAEYREPGLAVDTHVAKWRNIELAQRMRVQWRVGDPNSITQRDRGTVISLQAQYARLGYNFALGSSDRDTRIWQLGRLIHLRRFVVSEDLPMTIEALKNYQWKDLTPAQRARGEDPKEEPLKKNTDLVEAAQFMAGRFLPFRTQPYTPPPQTFSDEIWAEVRRRQLSGGERPVFSDLGIPQ